MATPAVPVIDYAPMIQAAREARVDMAHQLAAPFVAGLHSAAVFTGLVLLAVLALAALVLGLRTREFTWAMVGIAACAVLGILLAQLLAVVTLSWRSVATGFGVIAVCVMGGWRVTGRVLSRLF